MNEPYENNNNFPWDSDSTYRYVSPKKQKKNVTLGKVIAIALVCSLLGGVLGAGGMFLGARYLMADPKPVEQTDVSNLLEGQRESAVIKTNQISTGKYHHFHYNQFLGLPIHICRVRFRIHSDR